jgi:hypothetical protein
MPSSRGIHFAYVTISDGRGGYVEQQYAVNGDNLDLLRLRARRSARAAPAVTDTDGRPSGCASPRPTTPGSSPPPPTRRRRGLVFLPDVQVQLFEQATGALVFGGTTDLSGELDLPKLVAGTAYTVRCTAQNGTPLQDCRNFVADDQASVRTIAPILTDAQNLRLFGHVA